MKNFFKEKIIVILIFILALSLRVYGLNWDSNFHLHPDERFLTMVANDISLPSSLSQYLSSKTSPLNPYNYSQYQFFVYGTFPLFLTKFLAVFLHLNTYNHLTLLGRILSAIFDASNVILLYFLAKKILKSFYIYLPSLFYAFLVLPLQLSHFFVVDTFLNFFLLLTFTLLSYNLIIPAFIAFGLALACKISALYFLPVIVLLLFLQKKKISSVIFSFFFFVFSFFTFRFFQPYAFDALFTPNPSFISNLQTLAVFASANGSYPPSVQWLHRIPLLNSFYNIAFWGCGLAFFTPLILLSLRYLLLSSHLKFSLKLPKLFSLILIIVFWIIFLFLLQGTQFTHTMRYFLPIYPFFCLLLTFLLFYFHTSKICLKLILLFHLIYAFAFIAIYSFPHSRVQASDWINQSIPIDSILSAEYWDDALPLNNSGHSVVTLDLYAPDTEEKWLTLNDSLSKVDFLIMSSNRLWASIPRVPEKYPQASQFYQQLFSGNTDFNPLRKIVSYPGFHLPFLKSCYYFGPSNYPGVTNSWLEKDSSCSYPGIYLRDDLSEEAFTVYDHPQVLIFAKRK